GVLAAREGRVGQRDDRTAHGPPHAGYRPAGGARTADVAASRQRGAREDGGLKILDTQHIAEVDGGHERVDAARGTEAERVRVGKVERSRRPWTAWRECHWKPGGVAKCIAKGGGERQYERAKVAWTDRRSGIDAATPNCGNKCNRYGKSVQCFHWAPS